MAALETSDTRIVNLESFEKAMEEVDPHHLQRLFWRGQKECSWSLQPGVFRDPRPYNESALLWDFLLRGTPRTERALLRDDYVGWIHLAQHYRLPTRLLDWTLNPLVGLFFAVWDDLEDKHDGALWSLDAAGLNEAQNGTRGLFLPHQQPVFDMILTAFGQPRVATDPLPSVVALGAFESDMRMVVQQSAFTIHRDETDLRSLDAAKPFVRRWIIPHDSKGFLRRRLRAIGFSRSALFPDLEHLAGDLRLTYDEFQTIGKLLRERGEAT